MGRFSESELQDLVCKVKSGDKEAFGAIYDELFNPIYAYVAYRVRSKSDAEDLTQNIFIKALEALPRYKRGGAPLSAWFFRIAHNHLVNFYRQSGREQAVEIDDVAGTLVAGDKPEEKVVETLSISEIITSMRELTEDQQVVVSMKFIAGLTNDEIAEATGKPVGAVKSLQHRGLARLGRILGIGAEADGDKQLVAAQLLARTGHEEQRKR